MNYITNCLEKNKRIIWGREPRGQAAQPTLTECALESGGAEPQGRLLSHSSTHEARKKTLAVGPEILGFRGAPPIVLKASRGMQLQGSRREKGCGTSLFLSLQELGGTHWVDVWGGCERRAWHKARK